MNCDKQYVLCIKDCRRGEIPNRFKPKNDREKIDFCTFRKFSFANRSKSRFLLIKTPRYFNFSTLGIIRLLR